MTDPLIRDSRAVFLPAFDTLSFHDMMAPFIEQGGCAVLIGETREEYVARRMSPRRLEQETAADFFAAVEDLRKINGNLLVGVDEEMGGIQRLQGLVPSLPTPDEAAAMTGAAIEKRCETTAAAALELGVNMFLSPIADVVDGINPWLSGRTLGKNVSTVSRIVEHSVRGLQAAGIGTVTKHFPGFNNLVLDPAEEDVVLTTDPVAILRNAAPFTAAIRAGTKAIMAGPAVVAAFDPEHAACRSPTLIRMLREEFGFNGVVVSDDLHAPATLKNSTLLTACIDSLNAGTDLLLVGGGPELTDLSDGIAEAVRSGLLDRERLTQAANRVRTLAASLSKSQHS